MVRFFVVKVTSILYTVAALMLALGIALLAQYALQTRTAAALREDVVPALAMVPSETTTGLSATGTKGAASATATPEPTPAGPQATPFNMFAPVPGAPEVTDDVAAIEPDDYPMPGDVRIEVVRRTPHPTGPKRVLIYHTHTWEAFEQTAGQQYLQTEKWRTKDPQHNIVRVGEALAEELRARGIEVVHDTTDLEPPELASSYTRSLALLEEYRARGETFDYYIDLHRDAYNESMKNTNTVQDGGQELARLRMLIGKGTGQTGVGFEQRPNWEVNIVLAQALTDALNAQVPDLARPVITKSGRFNQHVSESAILIEVGNNKNTLEQALAAMPYLGKALAQVAER